MNPPLHTLAGKPRARALGIPFEGRPGPWNAITDVPGVGVGHVTLIAGEGPLVVGRGPVRTGVTAIVPVLARPAAAVWAGMHALNGNGELTGAWWVAETGKLGGPVTITNTHACGLARDATVEWLARRGEGFGGNDAWGLPVAGETWDGSLNDIDGFHVRKEHVWAAIEAAAPGPVEEGSVGGGTGMMLYGHKGGAGTASRVVEGGFTLGVFVQANFGLRRQLVVAGVPMGPHLPGPDPYDRDRGSIIAVVATDAPLIGPQLARLARRVSLGVARGGSVSGNGSGDIFLAFSTAGSEALSSRAARLTVEMLADDALDPLFEAVVQATDEAIMNVLAVSEPMTGIGGRRAEGLDRDRLVAALKRFGRWTEPALWPGAAGG
jgi:L-aminopeptidase/D-esterase-like protein